MSKSTIPPNKEKTDPLILQLLPPLYYEMLRKFCKTFLTWLCAYVYLW